MCYNRGKGLIIVSNNKFNNNNLPYGLSHSQADNILAEVYKKIKNPSYDNVTIPDNLSLDNIDDEDNNTIKSYIDIPTTRLLIKQTTGISSYDELLQKNKNGQLDLLYKNFAELYGFDSFHDMYLYSWSTDQQSSAFPFYEEIQSTIQKSNKGNNSNSNLVPVKRMINRGGKQVEVTIWQKPEDNEANESEGDKKPSNGSERPSSGSSGGSNSPSKVSAKELSSKVKGEKTPLHPKEIAELKQSDIISSQTGSESRFLDTMDYYVILEDGEANIQAVIGMKIEGEYLTMPFVEQDGTVSGLAVRGFFETVRMALSLHLGIRMKDSPSARSLFTQYEMYQLDSDSEGNMITNYNSDDKKPDSENNSIDVEDNVDWVLSADELKEVTGHEPNDMVEESDTNGDNNTKAKVVDNTKIKGKENDKGK